MAFSTSEQRQQLYPFSFNSISKRKLEPEDSASLVQENGIFIPRCEKRQKFSTESEKMEELTENSYSMDQHTVSEVVQDANEQSEMYDEEMSESSQDSNFTSKESEEENEIKEGIVTNTYAHLQSPRAMNCTAPRLHSYCFEHGILDNIIMSYHGS